MRAGVSGPLLRRGHRWWCPPKTPTCSRPPSTSCGRWATSRTAATSWRSWAGRRSTPAEATQPRQGLGDRVLLHHLPAAARPRAGDGAHDPAPPRALGGARAGRARPGRHRADRRRLRAGRRPGQGNRSLRRHRAAAGPRSRAVRPAPSTDARRRARRDHGGARPPAGPGHVAPGRPAPSRGCPGRAAGLDQVRGRAGSRSALATLRGRRDTAGHLPDRFDRLGAHPADVRLRPRPVRRPAGSGSA